MLPADLAAAPRALQDALKYDRDDRRRYVAGDVDGIVWEAGLLRPERETFRGRTLDEVLAWCLV